MSKGYVPYLSCNGASYRKDDMKGCVGIFEGQVHQRIRQVRADAKAMGWKNKGRIDICPGCLKTGVVP